MDKKDFFHFNGTILRTLNIIRGSRCGLKSIEFLFSGRIGHADFLECVRYLAERKYIKFLDCEGMKSDLRFTDIVLSDVGIKVLRGEILDDLVEV